LGKGTETGGLSACARIGTISTTLDSFGSSYYKPEVSPAPAQGVLHRAFAVMSMEPRRILPSGSRKSLDQPAGPSSLIVHKVIYR
jgi:hypothetical protein